MSMSGKEKPVMSGGIFGFLDKEFKSSRFLNAFIGVVTFVLVLFFWIAVCLAACGTNEQFWEGIEPFVLFGDSFVPSAITYCLGIMVQNIIALGEHKLEHYSGIIIELLLLIIQIILYLLYRMSGTQSGGWVFLVCFLFPIAIAVCSVYTCNKSSAACSLSG